LLDYNKYIIVQIEMKILVTGGNGFIGSHLLDSLAEDGHESASFDATLNFSDKPRYYKRCLAIRKRYLKNKPAKEYVGDIRKINNIKYAIRDFKPEVVVHLAGLPMARVAKHHERAMSPINMLGTINVLKAFEAETSARRIVYTSSSMAYGHFKQMPQGEDFLLTPENEYGAAKAAGEYYTRLSRKEWVIARPTSVYGLTDCANRVTQLLLDAAHMKKSVWVVRGETLDFSYIKDVVDGFKLLITKPIACRQTFNVSSGEARAVTEFASIVKSYFPKFEYEIREPSSQQVYRGPLDISKAKKVLKYRPHYSIEKGIKEIMMLIKEYKFYDFKYD